MFGYSSLNAAMAWSYSVGAHVVAPEREVEGDLLVGVVGGGRLGSRRPSTP